MFRYFDFLRSNPDIEEIEVDPNFDWIRAAYGDEEPPLELCTSYSAAQQTESESSEGLHSEADKGSVAEEKRSGEEEYKYVTISSSEESLLAESERGEKRKQGGGDGELSPAKQQKQAQSSCGVLEEISSEESLADSGQGEAHPESSEQQESPESCDDHRAPEESPHHLYIAVSSEEGEIPESPAPLVRGSPARHSPVRFPVDTVDKLKDDDAGGSRRRRDRAKLTEEYGEDAPGKVKSEKKHQQRSMVTDLLKKSISRFSHSSPKAPTHQPESCDLAISEHETLKIFCRQNPSDLLRCLTAKTSKTARQRGKDVGKSGLAEEGSSPRFLNRRVRSGFVKPDHFRDRRDVDRDREYYWKAEQDRGLYQRRVIGTSYDWRLNHLQVVSDEAICLIHNNLHLLLYKSYCGDIALNRRQVLTGETNPGDTPDVHFPFVKMILMNMQYRAKLWEEKRRNSKEGSRKVPSLPPPERGSSSKSNRLPSLLPPEQGSSSKSSRRRSPSPNRRSRDRIRDSPPRKRNKSPRRDRSREKKEQSREKRERSREKREESRKKTEPRHRSTEQRSTERGASGVDRTDGGRPEMRGGYWQQMTPERPSRAKEANSSRPQLAPAEIPSLKGTPSCSYAQSSIPNTTSLTELQPMTTENARYYSNANAFQFLQAQYAAQHAQSESCYYQQHQQIPQPQVAYVQPYYYQQRHPGPHSYNASWVQPRPQPLLQNWHHQHPQTGTGGRL